ncbi:MAG: hypothetical protein WBH50_24035 [Fuerstiella sp.]
MIRLAIHIITFTAALASLLCIIWMMQSGDMPAAYGSDVKSVNMFWFRFMPFATACAVLIPLIIWDIFRITNRLAGPLYRFEEVMSEFEATGILPEAKLRDNDLLDHFCTRFNRFVATMHERYPECRPEQPSQKSTTDRSTVNSKTELETVGV